MLNTFPPSKPQKRGTKALILDPAVSGPLSLLDVSLPELLAEHGVTKCVKRGGGVSRRA